jgi:two-component system sensor histidine kinase KdpD
MGALFELARDLSSALTLAATAETGMRYLANLFNVQPAMLVLDDKEQLQAAPGSVLPDEVEPAIVQWVREQQCAAGRGTAQFDSAPALYLPLKAPMRTRGVLVLVPRGVDWQLQGDQRGLLETVAALIAIALERIHFVSVAQDALIHMESEHLRNSLLAALSHDLKTPLTVLVGLADAISLAGPALAPAQADIVAALREQALSTSTMVINLLEMAKLQAGNVRLQREWQPLEEVIGVALQARANILVDHRVRVLLPLDLPLVAFDTLLMEHVLCNLLENAAKYTAPGSCIEIAAHSDGEWVEITVADDGPGLPSGDIDSLFEKFARGQSAPSGSDTGMGLGLSIVRAVIEAHQGTVTAYNRAEGGACICMRLPAGTPPSVPVEET